jgi:hypothetical protein
MKHDQRQKNQPGQSQTPASAPLQSRPTSPLQGHSYAAGQALQSLHSQNAMEPRARPEPSSLVRDAAALHANHGETLAQAAAQARVPAAGLAAIVLAEQHFLPTRVDERMPLRFLPYEFWLATGRWLVDSHKDQASEYRALQEAQQLDPQAALQATRMGIGQVGGAEAEAAGFASAAAMQAELATDAGAQVRALGAVAATDVALGDALRAEDWRSVATLRAGPAAGALGYDDALAAFASSYQPFATGGGEDEAGAPRKRRR